jgi:hypothetical protein
MKEEIDQIAEERERKRLESIQSNMNADPN